MIDREKVIKGLEEISDYFFSTYLHSKDREKINEAKDRYSAVEDALVLLTSPEAAQPMVSAQPGTTYQRLMAIKEELEAKNHTLTTEVRELRRLTESLSGLCDNLLKRLAAYET